MTTTGNTKYDDLVRKLKEIFQIDKPELDFGIYRILHARQKEIADFLDNQLKRKVQEALAGNAAGEEASLKKELDDAVAQAKGLGIDPDASPKVKELKARLAEMGSGEQSEGEVYSHLLTFFGRYYEDGDFVSKRRYKGDDTYAIPYSGEEVKLHWANADQYYTKTGESFTNYDFTLEGGAKVHFSLVTAETAKDNIKDNDFVRCFVLWDPENTPTGIEEEEADRYPSDFIEEKDGELFIYFQYLKFKKGAKQKAFLDEAKEKVLARLSSFPIFSELESLIPTEKDKDKKGMLLQKHLGRYTAKNTSDYFIHKDLGGFLSRELDFYIKNEMMHLDDIADATAFRQIEANLRKIQTVRVIALKLIDFMAQLENFQKKLWLKKKFVVQCDWCMTLDLVPEELRAEVLANEAQKAEWKQLGFDDSDSLYRMVDTRFFSESFKAKLLKSIDNLDERTDGVLIHSENFQALRLMQERYNGLVKCIYIDPPYNTDASKILYKNDYEHSSWLSLMENRLRASKQLLSSDGVIEVAIDDYELRYLHLCLDSVFGKDNCLSNIAIQTNPKGRDQEFVAQAHDYTLIYGLDKRLSSTYSFKLSAKEVAEKYKKASKDGALRELPLKRTGSDKRREDRPGMYFPFIYDPSSRTLSVVPKEEYKRIYVNNAFDDAYVDALREKYTKQGFVFILPLAKNGEKLRWRWGYDASVLGSSNGILFCKQVRQGNYVVYQNDFADDEATPKSLWFGKRYDASSKGTNLLNAILPGNSFDYPKSLYTVLDALTIGMTGEHTVLDYFAGSGTTGHAVIDLNRQDWEKGIDAKRKYILVEMGEHFNTVLKPRIEKVVYSPDWKEGKPESHDKGISHCFKYMTLESYEDTLNNMELKDVGGRLEGLLKDEFLIKYMLNMESRGSIIDTESFRHPFDYKLKVAVDSSGASEMRKIDLVETFNWLIGIRVSEMRRRIDQGVVIVTGMLPGEDKESLIIWRDVDKMDNAALLAYLKSNAYISKKDGKPMKDWSAIYVNGDHAIPNRALDDDEDAPVLTIRQIENVFLEKMFEEA